MRHQFTARRGAPCCIPFDPLRSFSTPPSLDTSARPVGVAKRQRTPSLRSFLACEQLRSTSPLPSQSDIPSLCKLSSAIALAVFDLIVGDVSVMAQFPLCYVDCGLGSVRNSVGNRPLLAAQPELGLCDQLSFVDPQIGIRCLANL
jgi:hypothetical protein